MTVADRFESQSENLANSIPPNAPVPEAWSENRPRKTTNDDLLPPEFPATASIAFVAPKSKVGNQQESLTDRTLTFDEVRRIQEKVDSTREIADTQYKRIDRESRELQNDIRSAGTLDWLTGDTDVLKKSLASMREHLANLDKRRLETDKALQGSKMNLKEAEQLELEAKKLEEQGKDNEASQMRQKSKAKLSDSAQSIDGKSFFDHKSAGKLLADGHKTSKVYERAGANAARGQLIAEGVRNTAVVAGAAVATGGVGFFGGVAIGTGIGFVSNLSGAVTEVGLGQKSAEQAGTDALKKTVKDAFSATTTAAGTKLAVAITGKATGISPFAQGATGGGVNGLFSGGVESLTKYRDAALEFERKFSSHTETERTRKWEEFKEARGLTVTNIGLSLASDTAASSLGGSLGALAGGARHGASAIRAGLIGTGEIASDTAIGVGTAYTRAKLEGRALTTEDIIAHTTTAITGNVVGGLSAAPRNALKVKGNDKNPSSQLARILSDETGSIGFNIRNQHDNGVTVEKKRSRTNERARREAESQIQAAKTEATFNETSDRLINTSAIRTKSLIGGDEGQNALFHEIKAVLKSEPDLNHYDVVQSHKYSPTDNGGVDLIFIDKKSKSYVPVDAGMKGSKDNNPKDPRMIFEYEMSWFESGGNRTDPAVTQAIHHRIVEILSDSSIRLDASTPFPSITFDPKVSTKDRVTQLQDWKASIEEQANKKGDKRHALDLLASHIGRTIFYENSKPRNS